jgi:hypothetical protein
MSAAVRVSLVLGFLIIQIVSRVTDVIQFNYVRVHYVAAVSPKSIAGAQICDDGHEYARNFLMHEKDREFNDSIMRRSSQSSLQ